MALGHGLGPWPWAMALGHGPWPKAMALGHGRRPWSWAMAEGHGLRSLTSLIAPNEFGTSLERVWNEFGNKLAYFSLF